MSIAHGSATVPCSPVYAALAPEVSGVGCGTSNPVAEALCRSPRLRGFPARELARVLGVTTRQAEEGIAVAATVALGRDVRVSGAFQSLDHVLAHGGEARIVTSPDAAGLFDRSTRANARWVRASYTEEIPLQDAGGGSKYSNTFPLGYRHGYGDSRGGIAPSVFASDPNPGADPPDGWPRDLRPWPTEETARYLLRGIQSARESLQQNPIVGVPRGHTQASIRATLEQYVQQQLASLRSYWPAVRDWPIPEDRELVDNSTLIGDWPNKGDRLTRQVFLWDLPNARQLMQLSRWDSLGKRWRVLNLNGVTRMFGRRRGEAWSSGVDVGTWVEENVSAITDAITTVVAAIASLFTGGAAGAAWGATRGLLEGLAKGDVGLVVRSAGSLAGFLPPEITNAINAGMALVPPQLVQTFERFKGIVDRATHGDFGEILNLASQSTGLPVDINALRAEAKNLAPFFDLGATSIVPTIEIQNVPAYAQAQFALGAVANAANVADLVARKVQQSGIGFSNPTQSASVPASQVRNVRSSSSYAKAGVAPPSANYQPTPRERAAMDTVIFARMSGRTLAALERLAPVLKLLPAAARVKIADAGALVPPAWGDYGAPRGAYSEAGRVSWKGVTFPRNGSAFSTYNIMRPEGAWFGHQDAGAWEAGTSYSVNVQTVLNVRASPSTSGQIIATLGRGSIVVATGEQTPDGWVQIEGPAGVRGWSSGKYLVPVAAPPVASQGQNIPAGRYEVTGDGVRLRAAPSTVDGAILGAYNRGAIMVASGANQNSFAEVVSEADGKQGWMSTSYLAPASAVAPVPQPSGGGIVGAGLGPITGSYSPGLPTLPTLPPILPTIPGGTDQGTVNAGQGGPSGGEIIDPNKVGTLPTTVLQARTILAAWDRKVGKGDYGQKTDFENTADANDRQRAALARFQAYWGKGLAATGDLDGPTYTALQQWAKQQEVEQGGGAGGGDMLTKGETSAGMGGAGIALLVGGGLLLLLASRKKRRAA